MKKTTLLFLLLTCCLLVSAQPVAGVATASGATAQVVRDGERERINTQRARLDAGFTAEDIACYKKFLTNKCLAEVKVRRDAVSSDALKNGDCIFATRSRNLNPHLTRLNPPDES